ncbi:hypothetical protein PAMP_008130 [Pampus punctatissimus]
MVLTACRSQRGQTCQQAIGLNSLSMMRCLRAHCEALELYCFLGKMPQASVQELRGVGTCRLKYLQWRHAMASFIRAHCFKRTPLLMEVAERGAVAVGKQLLSQSELEMVQSVLPQPYYEEKKLGDLMWLSVNLSQ